MKKSAEAYQLGGVPASDLSQTRVCSRDFKLQPRGVPIRDGQQPKIWAGVNASFTV